MVNREAKCWSCHFQILMDIFDRLFFLERKPCALVCRRWHSILRSSYYMSRIKCTVNHCYEYLIEPFRRNLLSHCGHICFNDCGSVPGFVCSNLIPAYKAQDQPGPSTAQTGLSMEDFLFSGKLPVRALTVSGVQARFITHVASRLKSMPDLEELLINYIPAEEERYRVHHTGPGPHWKLEHPNLRSLTILLYIAGPLPYELVLPKLVKLALEVDSDNELMALERYSAQLEDLWLLFYFTRAMEQILTYPFPKLRKLNLKRYGENDPPDPNTRVDDASAERFITSAPLLEDVTLRNNVITMRMLRAVCVIGKRSVTRLTLAHCVLPRRLFVFIAELEKLEYLKLKNVALEDEDRPVRVNFPALKQLHLTNSGTCIRFDDGLSSVTHFKYTVDSKLAKICRHMWQLEDFEIKLRAKYPVAEFVRNHFHSLSELPQTVRTLRLSGIKTVNRPWDFSRPMPTVEHLVLRKCNLVRGDFAKLPKLFPSLRLLELIQTCIAYKRCPSGVKPLVHFTGRLKQFFPNCRVLVHPDSSTELLATVLEMEDEFKWKLKRMWENEITIEPACPKLKRKWEAKRLRTKQKRLEQEALAARLEQEGLEDSEPE
uniref:F-box domain-containing protein n=1 Tax=Anopheles atroparvus TaxID=41427 RepID=A0A182ILY3_ANOAO